MVSKNCGTARHTQKHPSKLSKQNQTKNKNNTNLRWERKKTQNNSHKHNTPSLNQNITPLVLMHKAASPRELEEKKKRRGLVRRRLAGMVKGRDRHMANSKKQNQALICYASRNISVTDDLQYHTLIDTLGHLSMQSQIITGLQKGKAHKPKQQTTTKTTAFLSFPSVSAAPRNTRSMSLEDRFKKAVWLIRNGPAKDSDNDTKLAFYKVC